MSLNREELVSKVLSKMAKNQNIDAGLKDWVAGLTLSLMSAFGSLDAQATARDVDNFLSETAKSTAAYVRKHPELKHKFKIQKTFNSIGPESGGGSFSVTVGPYIVRGKYHNINGEFVQLKSSIDVDENASEEDLERFKQPAISFQKNLTKELKK